MATTNNTRENENKRKRLTQACELCRRKKVIINNRFLRFSPPQQFFLFILIFILIDKM